MTQWPGGEKTVAETESSPTSSGEGPFLKPSLVGKENCMSDERYSPVGILFEHRNQHANVHTHPLL
jgi:hypothetical protein